MKMKEKQTLMCIDAGIRERLYTLDPLSKWRWACRPVGFATSGGIGRIEVVDHNGHSFFVDVCFDVGLAENGLLTLYRSGAVELTEASFGSAMLDVGIAQPALPVPEQLQSQSRPHLQPHPQASTPKISVNSEADADKWFNIVFYQSLSALISNLHAKGELCLHIDKDGKTYNDNSEVYNFGEMPEITLWSRIIGRLDEKGLYAEIREGDCLFVSWA